MKDKCKREIERINKNKEAILAVLNTCENMSSADIAEATGLPLRTVIQTLIGLRREGEVSSILYNKNRNIRIWTVKKANSKNSDKPYPDLDKEHAEWVKQVKAKSRYNPLGK